MKLHLPKVLLAAVVAVLGVQYSGAEVTTEVKSGENAIVIGTGESAKTYNTTLITGDSNTGIKLTGNGAISPAEGTILGFGMTSSTIGTEAPAKNTGNYFFANYEYTGDILVYDSDTTDQTDMGLVINNGNSYQAVTFAGKVSGNGVISIVSSAPSTGITLKFTGNMSDYTGTMKGDCANKFAFEGATTGTGTIVSNGAISMTNTVINNSSISTTNTLSIAGATSITSALTLTATKLEISKALDVSAEGASITFGANTTLSLKVADLLAGNYTGTVKYDHKDTDTADSGYLRVENLELFTDYSKVSGANIQVEVSGSTTDEFTPSTKLTATFNGAYGIASDATYTTDVMGNAKTLILDKSATLTLTETPTAVTNGIIVKGTDTKLNLSGETTEISQSAISLMSGGKLKIKGDGTYKVATKTIATGVSLDTTWTGTVEYSGTGTDNALTDNLKNLGNENSTIVLKGASGHIKTQSGGLDGYTLELVDNGNTKALTIVNGSSRTSEEAALTDAISYLAADVKGTGSFVHNAKDLTYNHLAFTFEGDVSEWTGSFSLSAKTLALRFGGDASLVKASIGKTGGTLNLKVGNTGKKTTFTNTVAVDSISVDAGNTMSLGGTTTTASLTLGKDAIIDFAGGTLDVTGSLTLAAADVTVSELSSYFNAETLSATLVTISGEGNTLTVNNVNSWTGGAYSIDGQRYTTSLSVEDNSLKLNFTLANPETLDVYVTMNGTGYADGKLTLAMVDANGNLIDTAADNYNVIGLYGGAEWDAIRELITDGANPIAITLQGAEGFTIVGSGDTDADPEVGAGNVSFYGKYYGEFNDNPDVAGSYNPNYIPEPASATLGLAALMMLATRRRRKA